jgi:D-amino peptidase
MEGISGITRPEQVKPGQALYPQACAHIAGDVNACVEGCFRGGAKAVTVWDAHGSGVNIPWEMVDERVELIQGASDLGRLHDIKRHDALILLGYHAMAGERAAILEHTMSSASWQNLWINGRQGGEIAVDAGIAGDEGVPVIMVSGDDKACAEARRWIKGVHTAQVKVGYSSGGGRLLSKASAHRLIAVTAEAACRDHRGIKPLVHRKPVRMRLELVERERLPMRHAGNSWFKVIDGRTFEITGATTREALLRC